MPTPSDNNCNPQGSACPSEERLAALLASPAGDDPEVAEHLDACETCRRRLDGLAGEGTWLHPLKGSGGVPREGSPTPGKPGAMWGADRDVKAPANVTGVVPELQFLSPTAVPGYIGRLGPYNVIELVGQGGMGIVLKAHDPSLDRIVAIKVLSPAWAAHPTARKRFVREARAAAAVSHEHVVTIHAVDEAGGLPFLVMQFIGGRSLEARIRATGALKIEEILRIGMQTASGLAAAHAQGLVHRDIKPANIMLENGIERVKITDFGLARAADDAAVTLTGQVTGTPMYMAPEQARGERVDHRSDLFSLGAVLYAMCTGQPPFAAANPLTSLRKVCEEEPRPVERLNESIPGWLGDIVRRLMAKDPAARPRSASGVAEELARHLARIQNTAKGGAEPHFEPRRRGRAARLVVGGICFAVATFGVIAISGMRGLTRVRSWLWTSTDAAATGRSGSPRAEIGAGAYAVVPVVPGGSKRSRSFATLTEAIAEAGPGEAVEIRLDGRVPVPRIDVGAKPLFLRAGEGFSPVLAQAGENEAIVTSRGPLVLEGIAFEGSAADTGGVVPHGETGGALVVTTGGPVLIANCRFVVRAPLDARFGCVRVADVELCEIRNSELYALRSTGVQWLLGPEQGGALRLRNCATGGRFPIIARNESDAPARLDVEGSSFLCVWFLALHPEARARHLSVELTRSVFVAKSLVHELGPAGSANVGAMPWKDWRCLFDIGRPGMGDLVLPSDPADESPTTHAATTQPQLVRSESIEAEVRFRGDFREKFMREEAPVASDFALSGVRGPGGRRFPPRVLSAGGVQPHLVGPGAAYEAFKKSPAYVQWQEQAEGALRGSR